MAYCAVGLRTESGDSYTLLVEWRRLSDIPAYLYDILDEELSYVYDISVDSGISPELDDQIVAEIQAQVSTLRESH